MIHIAQHFVLNGHQFDVFYASAGNINNRVDGRKYST
jgi:hypothetical protein